MRTYGLRRVGADCSSVSSVFSIQPNPLISLIEIHQNHVTDRGISVHWWRINDVDRLNGDNIKPDSAIFHCVDYVIEANRECLGLDLIIIIDL